VLEYVRDYAEVLWRSAAWTLAADCCRTIVRHARTSAENAIIPLTYDRLGNCLRARGESDAALEAFQTGRSLASSHTDIAADLQLRISEASLELQRGNDTAAECMLDDVTVEATFSGLPRLGARAVHDRGVIAYKRGDTARALELFLRALAGYGDDAGAERALADIALVWLDQGYRDIARNVFQALATYSAEQSQRWTATVNLMHIAVLDADEPLFAAHCRTLSRASLSIRHEAHYHLFAAEGWLRFKRPTLARKALGRAADAIRRGGVAELATRLSDCQRELETLPRKRIMPASDPDQPRDQEISARSVVPDFQPLMARTSAAALAWRGGRESAPSNY
jgi:tetratricopeptide (TPR) repeat protein